MNPDNKDFDDLWQRLKDSIRNARQPEAVRCRGGRLAHDGTPVQVGTYEPADMGEHGQLCLFKMSSTGWHGATYVSRADLIDIAHHALLRASQFPTEP